MKRYTLNQVRRKLAQARRSSRVAERGMFHTRTHLSSLREMLAVLEYGGSELLRTALKAEHETIATAARAAQEEWPSYRIGSVVEFLGDPPKE